MGFFSTLKEVGKAVLTGGLWNAAEAMGDVGEAADAATATMVAANAAMTALVADLHSFIGELEKLFTVQRSTPRTAEELWDDEVARLNELYQKKNELEQELLDLNEDPADEGWMDGLFGHHDAAIGGWLDTITIRFKISVVQAAIDEILYNEPGVIPTSLNQLKMTLERFNTVEQPLLEENLASLNENLEESKQVLVEVKKLFIVRRYELVPFGDLGEATSLQIRGHEEAIQEIAGLIDRSNMLARELRGNLARIQPESGIQRFPTIRQPTTPTSSSTVKTRGVEAKKSKTVPVFATLMKTAPQRWAFERIGSALKQPDASAYLSNLNDVSGRIRFYEREKLKLEKLVFRLRYRVVEEPGVIPKILEEVRLVMVKVNVSLDAGQRVIEGVMGYSQLIKIGVGLAAVLTLVILFLAAVVLFRMAFRI